VGDNFFFRPDKRPGTRRLFPSLVFNSFFPVHPPVLYGRVVFFFGAPWPLTLRLFFSLVGNAAAAHRFSFFLGLCSLFIGGPAMSLFFPAALSLAPQPPAFLGHAVFFFHNFPFLKYLSSLRSSWDLFPTFHSATCEPIGSHGKVWFGSITLFAAF